MFFAVLGILAQCLLIIVATKNVSVMVWLMVTKKRIYDLVPTQYSANCALIGYAYKLSNCTAQM